MELAPGEGVCEVARRGAGSAVVRLAARSPLRLLTPRNHGGAAWVVTTSYGGGLVDGDALRIALRVGPGAAAYLATQSSTKVYPGAASQTIVADVGDGGLLVSLPDPVVCFAGARYRQDATIRLGAGAGLVWLDGLTAGRAARGERWRFAGYRARTRIERGGDTFALDGL
ncbi:MAG TPA: urease accessory protein UreD, partial [Haliangiales bacterium]|nr:urease accessory protein UreD [Haliangiales bacterium]